MTNAITPPAFIRRRLLREAGAVCFWVCLWIGAFFVGAWIGTLIYPHVPSVVRPPAPPQPIHLSVLKVEGAPSSDDVERFVVAVVEALKSSGRYDAGSERRVGVEVKVTVAEELVPPEPEHVRYFVEHTMAVPPLGRRIEIEWAVFEGKKLGTVMQKNWIPAEQDAWMAFMDYGGVPAGVKGVLKLTDK